MNSSTLQSQPYPVVAAARRRSSFPMRHLFAPTAIGILVVLLSVPAALRAATEPLYQNDFQSAEPTTLLPEEFLVLGGDFAIIEDGDTRCLELPGAPLDTFGVLFGPSQKDNVEVIARIHGTNQKRRLPSFAVGLGSVGGYRLQISAAKRKIEMTKGDAILASADHTWKPDTWTWLRLQLVKSGDAEWTVRGRAWSDGQDEPDAWLLSFKSNDEPYGGRASVWGKPYAGTPIRFDDLKVQEP